MVSKALEGLRAGLAEIDAMQRANPDAFIGLFSGANTGKMLVRL